MKKVITILSILFATLLFAQRPSGIPGDTGTISLSSKSDVIIYIIIPIVIIVLYLVWKRTKKNDNSSEN
ncbi:adenylosuccinate synthetase [Flavobacterium orientale]|uniref:Adenylosuccinate synthetase n=1 Tax=Flavobacterium orientale TaxID=1756020 RepID=A0A916XVI7_9FLAO|nr:adenylosuccinate synthetase [Flavobacterium orientale]GGD16007.1 hypothetical protein GCM10011343_03690 [Flavobacterium orientale]